MASELDRKVRRAVLTVKRRKVLDRILDLMRHYKALSQEERSDHIRSSGELKLSIGGGTAVFRVKSYGQFHQNMRFEVRYEEFQMLEARHGLRNEVADGVDPRLVVGNESHAIVVLTFKPGLWMKLLDLQWLARQEARRKQQEEKERQRRLQPAPPAPVRESDHDLSQRFAL